MKYNREDLFSFELGPDLDSIDRVLAPELARLIIPVRS